MTRYNALMDRVLKAGLHDAIKASGFRRKRPRLYVRETETGYDCVYFHRADTYGEWFRDALSTFYQPMADLYDEVFPDGTGDISFPDTRGPLRYHALAGMMDNLMTTVEPTDDGPHAFRVGHNKHHRKPMLLSKNVNNHGSWITKSEDLRDITDEIIGYWNTNAKTWFDRAKDPAFIASWLTLDRGGIHYDQCHSAAFYFLAGDHRRARKLLQDCIELGKTPFETLDLRYREGRFFGIFYVPSSEETRARAEQTLAFYKKLAAVAQTLADHCGYDIPDA